MKISSLTQITRTLMHRYRYPPYHALFRAAELRVINKFTTIGRTCGIVVDAGCGDGVLFGVLKSLSVFRKSVNVGVDVNVLTLRKAQSVYHDVVLADIQSLPFKKHCVEVLFSNSVIEHVDDPRTFLFEARRLLEQKGRLILTTVTDKFETNSPSALIYRYFQRTDMANKVVSRYAEEFKHAWNFTPDIFAELMRDVGLKLKSAILFFPPLLTATYFILYTLCRNEKRGKPIYIASYGLSFLVTYFIFALFHRVRLTSEMGAGMLIVATPSSRKVR